MRLYHGQVPRLLRVRRQFNRLHELFRGAEDRDQRLKVVPHAGVPVGPELQPAFKQLLLEHDRDERRV